MSSSSNISTPSSTGKTLSKKVIAYGGSKGQEFDDGLYEGTYDGVRKVIVGEDLHGIVYLKVQYVRNGAVVQKEHGRARGKQITETEFEVKSPDEYITSIWGTYRNDDQRYKFASSQKPDGVGFKPLDRLCHRTTQPTHADKYNLYLATNMGSPMYTNTVSELQFRTSHGRTSKEFGMPGPGGREFVLEGKNGTKLLGLHGRSSDFLDALGAYFSVVSSSFKHLEPRGGSNGVSWDDGDYDRLSKLCVGEDGDCVTSLEFHYVKGNNCITHCHGKDSKERKEFVLTDQDGEYVKSVEGTINKDGFVSSLTFKTSMNRSSMKFGKPVGTKFELQAKGFDKIVGFRGRSSVDRINALGAHFAVVVAPPVKKLNAKGGVLGEEWDDGIHDGVRMITVRYDDQSVKSVKFEYINGPVIGDPHGDYHKDDKVKEFKLYFNKEYITSVEGHYGKRLPANRSIPAMSALWPSYMTMLKFNTNRTTYEVLSHSSDYTYEGTPFKLEEKDHIIVGFHGKTEVSLKQIGVYVKPIDNP